MTREIKTSLNNPKFLLGALPELVMKTSCQHKILLTGFSVVIQVHFIQTSNTSFICEKFLEKKINGSAKNVKECSTSMKRMIERPTLS